MNLLQLLHQYEQSVWLDEFERGWISGGELQQYIEEDGLKGVRSNFQSLQAAIEGQEYDRDFTTLAQQEISRTAQSDYDYLIVRDLQLAADLLKPVHSQTQGRDGYVQIDLPPDAVLQPETAIAAAQSIWQSVGWSNLLLRIPAIPLLLPAIEQLISDRINVNTTLVFSPTVYEQVFNRYLTGLERLVQRGALIGNVVCFVSISIGCLDASMTPLIANSEPSLSMIQARLLYQRYRMLCQSIRWRSLPEGAKPLRLVWDCINIPPESAWRYLQQLAFPETVIMLPPSTLEMYRGVSLLPNHWTDGKQAERRISESQEYPWDKQVEQLVNGEMARSLTAFHQLLDTIEKKRRR
jgi:transaldolase